MVQPGRGGRCVRVLPRRARARRTVCPGASYPSRAAPGPSRDRRCRSSRTRTTADRSLLRLPRTCSTCRICPVEVGISATVCFNIRFSQRLVDPAYRWASYKALTTIAECSCKDRIHHRFNPSEYAERVSTISINWAGMRPRVSHNRTAVSTDRTYIKFLYVKLPAPPPETSDRSVFSWGERQFEFVLVDQFDNCLGHLSLPLLPG